MEILQSITLDFARSTMPITVFAKQFDKDTRKIEITPLNNGVSYTIENGVTARLQMTKSDGTTVINDATISNGKITVTLTGQCLTAAGTAVAEVGLYKGVTLLTSQTFYIEVQRGAYDESAPESSSEYGALLTAIAAAEQATQAASSAAELISNIDARQDIDGTSHSTVGDNIRFTQTNWLRMVDAYDKDVSEITTGQTHIDQAIDPYVIYKIKNSTGANIGWMICAAVNANAYTKMQIRALYSGELSYRIKNFSQQGSTWGNWIKFETETNKTTSLSASSTDTQYPSAKAVYDALVQKTAHTMSYTLSSASWSSQAQTLDLTSSGYTVTSYTKVDIQIDDTAYAALLAAGCTGIYVTNNSGSLTVHALGAAPTSNVTVQLTISEVMTL